MTTPDDLAEDGKRGLGRPAPVDSVLFSSALGWEVPKAMRLQYCISVLCVSLDLPEDDAHPQLLQRVARQLSGELRATDLVTTLPPTNIAVLLIDAGTRSLQAIADRVLTPARTAVLPGPGRVLSFSGGGACFPETAHNASELLGQAFDLMVRARNDGGDRLYLPR